MEGDERVDLMGVRIAALLAALVGRTRGKHGVMPGGGIMLSCGPSFRQPHPFDGGAFALVHGGPGQAQR